ncbi:MAG: urease accessory protein UreE [Hyphomicrobiales bacterium]|nr:urease accessory protein UreE [Hyphomicrobiales bacterium]
MIRAGKIYPQSAGSRETVDTVVLDSTERHRRRGAMRGVRGLEFLLDLPEAVMLRTGDAIMLDDGRLVEVLGKPEPLAEIRCRDPRQMAHVSWHLGNRHLPVQIFDNRIRIRRDHVIEEMVRGLGAKVALIEAAFDPEGGAYAAPVEEAHAHHDHDHHGHDHHDHSTCGHEHGHAHKHD